MGVGVGMCVSARKNVDGEVHIEAHAQPRHIYIKNTRTHTHTHTHTHTLNRHHVPIIVHWDAQMLATVHHHS